MLVAPILGPTVSNYLTKYLARKLVPTMMGFLAVGAIGGLICAFATIFKPNIAKYTAPAYAIFEGFVLGGLKPEIARTGPAALVLPPARS